MSLAPGQTLIDRYRIVALLGQGGFGAVYRGWDANLQRACAIKENLETSPEAQRQFEHEAQILAGLAHPALPRVLDHFFIPDQGQYLVMDYVDGQDLAEKLEQANGPLSETQVTLWIVQVCEALTYLHSQKQPIIHRDIKPANIRITSEGRAMLVDFGIAKVHDPTASTTMGARAVTPGYSPPEQYGMASTTSQSDIYALGATTYHMLTGHKPLESVQRMMGNIMPGPGKLNPAISAHAEQAVLKAMEPMPADRFTTAAGFAVALQGLSPVQGSSKPVLQVTGVSPQAAPAMRVAKPIRQPHVVIPAPPPSRPLGLPAHIPGWVWALGGLALVGMCVLLTVLAAASLESVPTAAPAVFLPTELPLPEAPAATTPAEGGQPTATTAALPVSNDTPTPTHTVTAANPPPEPSGDTPSACTSVGQRWLSPLDGMTLLCVPAGDFAMGSNTAQDPQAEANETPQHTVYVSAFWMDLTEVTNAMYEICVRAGACNAPVKEGSFTHSDYYETAAYDNYPVLHLTHAEALAYCRWRGGRLPTEAEWEKAARGADGRLYPWGSAFDGVKLNFCDSNCPRRQPDSSANDGYADTSPVGAFPAGASPYGLLDMAGNVWEFVMDWFGGTYYASSPASNPPGPAAGEVYVVRGGAWDSKASLVRVAVRSTIQPEVSLDYVGFRCMMSAP